MTRVSITLWAILLTAPAVSAEEAGKAHTGVKLEDSSFSNIDNIRVDIVDPGALMSSGGSDGFQPVVKTIRRPVDSEAILNPKGLNVVGESKGESSSSGKSGDFNFGVSAGGADGLMKTSINNNSNVVESLTLPDGTVKKNPQKESGGPLLKTDLANLATGKVSNINLRDGTPLGKPSSPQAG